MYNRRHLVLLAFILAGAPLALAETASKLVLEYSVKMNGESVGTSKAVLEDSASGRVLTLETKIKTTFMGMKVDMGGTTLVKYDGNGRALSFDISHHKPGQKIHATGSRSDGGWDIERKKGKKTKKVRIEDSEYDRVSIEKALYAGKVGTKKKVRVLFAGQGKVKKATISILGREDAHVMGRDASLVHFKIKSSNGTVEEWRLDDGILVKSRIHSPIGKILISLEDSKN
ncbi:MAG: DUF3108 domain-containing protein [Deltaproteobacteria bacterium]|nr:DUF3108 domain-containing protein [Deltaproteobacteria bacterium]